ncbi:MAG: hypothetical protein M1368_02680 [Thaumarchaeota archaeon]|nr:hypothetical protein [Nitrososphaerota archaeon]MDG6907369.1 hypothetical protein [Nitrososphaerota archaeon]
MGEKTVTRSFRISERALSAIEDEAKRQKVSTSTIINQELLSYAEFERFLRRLGLIKISSSTFFHLLQSSSDEELAKAGAEAGGDTPRSVILAKEGDLSMNSVMEYLTLLSEYAGFFELARVERGGKIVVTLIHRLGRKGSVFFSSYVKALFDDISYSPKISSSEHSVVLEIIP